MVTHKIPNECILSFGSPPVCVFNNFFRGLVDKKELTSKICFVILCEKFNLNLMMRLFK
jgi:hypothetical protein